MIRPPPRSTRTDTLFPYTTLFRAVVRMTLTAPGCGMGDILVDDVRTKLEMIPTVQETDVELVFDPPWTQNMMSAAERLRSEERRVGKECVGTCRSRWSPYHKIKNQT